MSGGAVAPPGLSDGPQLQQFVPPPRAAPPSTRSASFGNINIAVNGAGDPQAVGQAVSAYFERSVEAALSDGYGVMPA